MESHASTLSGNKVLKILQQKELKKRVPFFCAHGLICFVGFVTPM
jgi:hypothetical protein